MSPPTPAPPIQRAVLILASVHGLRPHAIRHLRLDDIDLGGAQLHLPSTLTSPSLSPSSRGGLRQSLGPIRLDALGVWLHERHRRWPLSANPHLLVTEASAPTTAVMSIYTLRQMSVGSGMTLDRLRRDRFLEEALTHGPDRCTWQPPSEPARRPQWTTASTPNGCWPGLLHSEQSQLILTLPSCRYAGQ